MCIQICEQSSFSDILLDMVNPTEADMESDETLNAWLMRNIGTSHHISGTCKMGDASDPMAVVDQYSHVHGMQNLRVVDASVMPDVIRANTNATTLMIAERVSDWIKEGK
ncbi:Choline dehydrogenase [hydrothermal vent metagenome]|uniref:Choline dehydrogenase n=2 Tax=ecological metagenomes TaxID=410657 RepID=A0A160V9R1_9ZZZZ